MRDAPMRRRVSLDDVRVHHMFKRVFGSVERKNAEHAASDPSDFFALDIRRRLLRKTRFARFWRLCTKPAMIFVDALDRPFREAAPLKHSDEKTF